MTQVIYADVLFIINTYITYALLVLTEIISCVKTSRLRITLAAFLGGAYSLIILIPEISDLTVTLSRLPVAVIFILTAFTIKSPKVFFRLFSCFFLTNFVFAGLMLALWYFLNPQNMYLGGFVIYFDIEPLTLIILTAICYFIVKVISSMIKIKQPKNTIFNLKVHINGKVIPLLAFYDTGNNLFDPFTGKPVIIVSAKSLNQIFPKDDLIYEQAVAAGLCVRFIPCSVLGADIILPCFTCDRVQIKGIEITIENAEAVIAITKDKIKGGEFSAILPSGIFDNHTNETGVDYDESFKLISHSKK